MNLFLFFLFSSFNTTFNFNLLSHLIIMRSLSLSLSLIFYLNFLPISLVSHLFILFLIFLCFSFHCLFIFSPPLFFLSLPLLTSFFKSVGIVLRHDTYTIDSPRISCSRCFTCITTHLFTKVLFIIQDNASCSCDTYSLFSDADSFP